MLLRVEYILLIVVVVITTIFAFAFFYFQVEVSRLKDYGYAGVFLVNFIGAASMILPTPAAASVVGGGAILNSYLGIPTFVLVGVVAGLAEALGEFTAMPPATEAASSSRSGPSTSGSSAGWSGAASW